MKRLFSERHGSMKPRISHELDDPCRAALLGLVEARIDEEWFGFSFPFNCQDGRGNAGTDTEKLKRMLIGYGVIWPADWTHSMLVPTDEQVFDLLEFSYEKIAEPQAKGPHSYFAHSHYSYSQQEGRVKFAEEVNRLFERNGMAFELMLGEVTRLAPTGLQEALAQAVFKTGDKELDELLEDARRRFLNRDFKKRRESLEKLWDAWERLKTIEPGKDKRSQANSLLEKASDEPNFLSRLESEAKELSEIGNKFMIRHTETNTIPINTSNHVDYLFQRMFAMIHLLLRSSGRGG